MRPIRSIQSKYYGSAVSKAAFVRKWAIVDGDFSIDGGELTPTMKLKRKVVYKKFEALIE